MRNSYRGILAGGLLVAGMLAFAGTMHCAVAADGRPRETHPGLDVRYDTVRTAAGFTVQTITTVPQGKSGLPAIVFVPWLSCDPVDYPRGPGDGWGTMLIDLVRTSGYVVVRIEKSGMGEGTGPACANADLEADVAGFRAALAWVVKMRDVDPTRVVLFGGSIGASLAPILARDAALAGIVVSGGHYKTWLEHMLEIERRRLRFAGRSPSQVNAAMRGLADFYALYLNGGMMPRAIAGQRPDLAPLWTDAPEHQYGRPARYYQQLQAQDIAGAWDDVRVPVLVVYGEYDWIMSREDQELIVATVNRHRAGTAKLMLVPRMDHHFTQYDSPERAFAEQGGVYARAVVPEILRWIDATLASRK